MDERKQHAFVQMVRERGGDDGEVAVTIDEFFDGNDDVSSIAANLAHTPSLTTIRRVLEGLRAHPSVHELHLDVEKLKWPQYPAGKWPYANRAGIVTTLDAPAVGHLAAEASGELVDATHQSDPPADREVPEGYHYVEVDWN